HHHLPRLIRRGPEDLDGWNHEIVQSGDGSGTKRAESAGAETDTKRLALPRQPPGEDVAVHAVDRRPGRLEDEVPVRVRQNRLLVRRPPAQVPADHPAEVHERRQVVRRRVPVQAEPGRGGRGAQHAGAHGARTPGGGVHDPQPTVAFVQDTRARTRLASSPMNLHAEMTDAADAAASAVDNVRRDQLTGPTPCPDWDVRTLLNHLILWTS